METIDAILAIALIIIFFTVPIVNAIIGYKQRQLPYWKRLKSTAQKAKMEYRGECMTKAIITGLSLLYIVIFMCIDSFVCKCMGVEIGVFVFADIAFGIVLGHVSTAHIYKKFYSAKIEEEIKVYKAQIVDWKQQKINSASCASYFPIYKVKLDDGKYYFIKGMGRYEKKSLSKNMIETIGIGQTTNKLFFEWDYYIEERSVWEIIWYDFILEKE